MTALREMAGAGPAVILADDTCTGVLSQVIADAVHDLPLSRWLVPGPAARRRVLPGYFELLIEHALADGIVHTTPGQDAVALWLPAGEEPAPWPGGSGRQLAAVTGPWADRFRAFGQALSRRHPTGVGSHYLVILAVRPDRQGHGLGSALLAAHHATLDRDGIPGCLHAADLRTRRLYQAHGYQARGLVFSPAGVMHPMVRQPSPASQDGQDIPGARTARATRQPEPGGAR